ncbi:DUF5716 family protein [Fodinisporobacter ferrooxydans]|uniref:DUF5716 family protein n=1 Tax=Fodinisporobacter ferrooxydans TaxID=2901836 RepID=A0ABY4CLQ8_9BACL|nr:DUF5716 family protein [Alicyclobacillaceae bacterium MYW30-H2]
MAAYLVDHMVADLMELQDEQVEVSIDNSFIRQQPDNLYGNNELTGMEGEQTLSGQAHALIRRLLECKWLTSVPDENSLDELLIVPDYAILVLDVLHSIVHPIDKPYNSFVYSTYSVLRTANEERDYMFPALQSAYDHTQDLLASLRALLHNIHKFYQSLQERQDIRGLLEEHFDEYQVLVAAKTYHPLKTVDSVHRFRPRILSLLREWLQDSEVLDLLVQSMRTHRSGIQDDTARYEIIRMIQFILDSFETMDSFLHEIDRRNSAYSRASVERIQYLLNSDRNTKGKLVELLKHLPKLQDTEQMSTSSILPEMEKLPIFRVEYTDSYGLFTEPTRRQRGKTQPLKTKDKVPDVLFAAEADELIERAKSLFSNEHIIEFILSQMPAEGILEAHALTIDEVEDFLRTMVAVIKADESDIPYSLAWDDEADAVIVNGYRIPALTFKRLIGEKSHHSL